MQEKLKRPIAQNMLAFVLDQSLRLLHPFVPFITEGIFQKLNEIAPERNLPGLAEAKKADALVVAAWPALPMSLIDETSEQEIATIQNVVRSVRDIRNQYNL